MEKTYRPAAAARGRESDDEDLETSDREAQRDADAPGRVASQGEQGQPRGGAQGRGAARGGGARADARHVTRAVARRLLREAQERQERERREQREREMAEAAERARQLAEMVGVIDDMPAAEPAHVQEPLVHAAEPNDECGFVEDFTCNLWLDAFDAGLLEA